MIVETIMSKGVPLSSQVVRALLAEIEEMRAFPDKLAEDYRLYPYCLIQFSCHEKWLNVIVKVVSLEESTPLAMVQRIWDTARGDGRHMLVPVEPEFLKHTDVAYGTVTFRGYARFFVCDELGPVAVVARPGLPAAELEGKLSAPPVPK